MQINATNIPGCLKIDLPIFRDDRGSFLKIFHLSSFERLGLTTQFSEEYVSVSKKNVIRGMHFQTPPHEHDKIVYCLDGTITDVVLDIRKKSPTYGQYEVFALNAENPSAIFIPKGCAHGFLATSQVATLLYRVGTEHASESDLGIKWDSFGYNWDVKNPIISKRDQLHKPLLDFESPF